MKGASVGVGVAKDGFSCYALRHNSCASRVYWLGFLRALGLDWTGVTSMNQKKNKKQKPDLII